jgi:hypothetical protein
MRWLAVLVGWPSPSFGTYALPFCHERFAARTSKTGKTSVIVVRKDDPFPWQGYGSEIVEVANLSGNVSLES